MGYSKEKKFFRNSEQFDFRIYDTPSDLYAALEEKEKEKPNSSRLVAGYCWPWSNPNPDGSLVKDVRIGNFAMPWETKGDRPVGIYPPWYKWAYKPNGFKQVGCIYTAQGFEFDYIGVIIGQDLVYDENSDRLKGNISATQDPTLRRDKKNFEIYMKNIYRVLLTRGMRGCYVYFVDKNTEKFFRKRME